MNKKLRAAVYMMFIFSLLLVNHYDIGLLLHLISSILACIIGFLFVDDMLMEDT